MNRCVKSEIDGEGFTDAQFLHDDEAQTVDGAVGLILVSLEVVEGGSLLVGTGPMDARQLLAVELISEPSSVVVADLPSQRDRFGDDVIRREQVIDEPQILEGSEDFDDARMVGVSSSRRARRGIPCRGRSHLRLAVEVVVVMLGHVGRGIVDEADQGFGGFPAGGVVNVGRDRSGYQDLHLRAFGEMDGLLRPEYAVLVNSLDGHWLACKPHFTPRRPRGFGIAWMARKTRFVTWNGQDLPAEFRDPPAGRYVVEAVEEETPDLSPVEAPA
jgi:hypothetical protein